MTESQYRQLTEFRNLPLYDEDSPFCSAVDHPEKEDREGTIWTAVHEVKNLKTARAHLKKENYVPRGGIRFWDGNRKRSMILAYFWEKK